MIESVIIFLGVLWLAYKFYVTKDLKKIFASMALMTTLFGRWPLYYSWYLTCALMAILSAGFLCYENYIHKKNVTPLAYMYIVFFLLFGSMFFMQFLTGR